MSRGHHAPHPRGKARGRCAKRLFLVILASVVMSANIQSFVDAGGLFPGGFTGLTLLIQRSAQQFAGIASAIHNNQLRAERSSCGYQL